MPAAAAIGAAIKIGGAIFGAGRAKREARRQRKRARALNNKINHLEANRQDVINPYDQVTSLASMATDLSSTMSNPMANLSVATKAAEMKIEQADISLANTLDTLAATGASAGGATALAQAALQSKKGVAASIEMQEKSNEEKRAQGEANVQQQKMAEERRMQQSEVVGKQFVYGETENREVAQLNRVAGQLGMAEQVRAQAQADQTGAITGMFGSLASIGGSMAGSGAFTKQ